MDICRDQFEIFLYDCSLQILIPGDVRTFSQPLNPDSNSTKPLVVGQLVIQLPSAYASDDSGSTSYQGISFSCGFVPHQYALQYSLSYAGVQHKFGSIRSGVQAVLIYDVGVRPKPPMSNFIPSLHESVGAVAPVTTQLITQLGQWLEPSSGRERESHLIYSLAQLTPAEEKDQIRIVTTALSHTNHWLQLLPGMTRDALQFVEFPRPIVQLIEGYLPSDFYRGFYWYLTTTSFRKYGDNSSMKFEYTSDPNAPFFIKPSSIHVSRSMDECLSAYRVGKEMQPPGKRVESAIVVLPASRLMELMTRTPLSTIRLLRDSREALQGRSIAATSVQTFVTAILRCNFTLNENVLVEAEFLLRCTAGGIPVHRTEWGTVAIRNFVMTNVYQQRHHLLHEGLADFLRWMTPRFSSDGRLQDAGPTFQLATILIRPPGLDGAPEINSAIAVPFVRRLCHQLDGDALTAGYSLVNLKRSLQRTLLQSLPLYGGMITDFASVWSIAVDYDSSPAPTLESERESGASMAVALYHKLLLKCEFNQLLASCAEIMKMDAPDIRVLGLLRAGHDKLRAHLKQYEYAHRTEECASAMTRIAAILEEAGFRPESTSDLSSSASASASASNDLKNSPPPAMINGVQVIEIDASTRPKRKIVEESSGASSLELLQAYRERFSQNMLVAASDEPSAASCSANGPKRCKPNSSVASK
jgi:hypothetical protein